jgi:hypothetical protein
MSLPLTDGDENRFAGCGAGYPAGSRLSRRLFVESTHYPLFSGERSASEFSHRLILMRLGGAGASACDLG